MKRGKNFLERGTITGGTSATNAMMWVSGAKEDFDQWANRPLGGLRYAPTPLEESFSQTAFGAGLRWTNDYNAAMRVGGVVGAGIVGRYQSRTEVTI